MLINKQEIAEKIGLKSFDCALPQDFLDLNSARIAKEDNKPHDEIYRFILQNFVWCYDTAKIFGEITPISPAGENFLPRFYPEKEKIFDVILEKAEYFNAYYPIKAKNQKEAIEKVKQLVNAGQITADNSAWNKGQYMDNSFTVIGI
jgi:hypothetical protein